MGFLRRCFIHRKGKQKYVNASYTVEAAVIVPIILFTIAGGIHISFHLFDESKKATAIQEEITELNPVKIIRNLTFLYDVTDKK